MRVTDLNKRVRKTVSKKIIQQRAEEVIACLESLLEAHSLVPESEVIGMPTALHRRVRTVVRDQRGQVLFWLRTAFGDLGWAVATEGSARTRKVDLLRTEPLELQYNDEDSIKQAIELIVGVINKAKERLENGPE